MVVKVGLGISDPASQSQPRTSPSFNRSLTIARRRRPPPTPSRVLDAQLRSSIKMAFANTLYRSLFSTNYLMLATVFSAGFAWEIGFNNVMDKVWDNNNRGRQWKDIRHKFIEGGDEDEE
ncbi:cytochrome b-c1 complex subunit 9 [Fusarium venenatum]|uniref:cytochrome b-c1 complex subunit 9 n=1 Tax=Fusarium venenatum TaxID=56646 RepID=UPI001D2B359B|nr:cytochrome b-c1 complex subunit 9 [Fusarium venenatum]